ncbi:hypothetical protein Tco_0018003 [Tanacetum coccineum]
MHFVSDNTPSSLRDDICGDLHVHQMDPKAKYLGLPSIFGQKKAEMFGILALLAKQWWRLIINPDAIWGRILKGIYFPNSNFLVAKKGSHPSWLWSSLLYGRDLLLQGVRWQVGNGRSISFWTQKWVPFSHDFYIRSPLSPFHNCNTVSDFIEDGHWNVRKLREHILATEAEMGQYTVKSGYKQAIALMSTSVSIGESSANPSSKFWKKKLLSISVDTPHGSSVKLNYDAAFKNSSAAFGIVARDSAGLLRYVIAISLSSLDMSPPWSLAALVEDIRIWEKNMHISWDVSFPDELTLLLRSDLYGS